MNAQHFLPFRHELIVDNFAGGGGASTGIEAAFGRGVDIAINHDGEAIAMHSTNHPHTRHLCSDVFEVDPAIVTRGQPVGLAWFSPDCKHFSKAKGGKPVEKKIRGLAWVVIRWAATVKPRVIMLENVEEFQDWGPLMPDGKPDPLRAGMTFRRWKRQLEQAGYVVDSRELRACDYGAPTIRKRLFVIARCDGRPIVWPKPTHGKGRGLKPYRTAAECIDWSLPCPSIFDRKRALKPATMARIARGIRRFVLEAKRPFIVSNMTNNVPRDVDEPMTTILTGNHKMLATPFIAPVTHPRDSRVHSVKEPFRTVTGAHRGEQALVAPVLVNTRNGERRGQAPRVRSLLDPCPTVTAKGSQGAIAAAYLEQANTGMTGHDARTPMSTIVGKGCTQRLVTAFLSYQYSDGGTASDVGKPAWGVSAGGQHHALVQAFMEEHFGPGDWTTVEIDGVRYRIVDIGMRMLTPRELFNAQGFAPNYLIEAQHRGKPLSKTAQVKLCGNSVSPPVAEALVRANFLHEAAYVAEGAA